jgi:hypothetical protein
MTDLFEDMFDTAGALNSVDTLTGKNLSDLVRALNRVEQQIEDAEQHVKVLKAEKQKLSVELIPSVMDEMGIERLDVDGVTVSRKMMVHASIPVARREEVYAWLRDNNLDDIIKNDVVVSFGKGEDNRAGHAVGLLRGAGFRPRDQDPHSPRYAQGLCQRACRKR